MEERSQGTAVAESTACFPGPKMPTEIWAQIFEQIIQNFFDEHSNNNIIYTEDYWLFRSNRGKGVSALRGLPAFEHVISKDRTLYRHFFSLRIQISRVVISSVDTDNNMFDNPKRMHDLSRLFRKSMRDVEIRFRSTTHERRFERRIIKHMREMASLLTWGLFSVTKIDHLTLTLDDNLSSIHYKIDHSIFAGQLLLGGIKRLTVRSPLKSLTIKSCLCNNEVDLFRALLSSLDIQDTPTQSYDVGITSRLPCIELNEFLGVVGKISNQIQWIGNMPLFQVVWVDEGGQRLPYNGD